MKRRLSTISAIEITEYQAAEGGTPTPSDTAFEEENGGAETAVHGEQAPHFTKTDTKENSDASVTKNGTDSPDIPEDSRSSPPSAPFMTVRYNHQSRDLNMEEAVTLAQKGLYFEEKLLPVYNKLDYLASQRGLTADALADLMLENEDERLRAELSEHCSDPETVERMVEINRQNRHEKYEKLTASRGMAARAAEELRRESLERRLAREYCELKAEFPEIESFSALPNSVKAQAAGGTDLVSAYLRYRHSEEKRIAASRKAFEDASSASAGSAVSGETEAPTDRAFIRGIWS